MTAILDAPPVYALETRAADATSPSRARHWLTWLLETAHVPQPTIDTATLVASELVTNAVVHSDSARVLVSAQILEAGLRLVVHDDATGGDWQAPGGEEDERGRGLAIVRAITAEFDITTHRHGTTITAVIA